jgi:DUF1680 family protein
VEQDEAVGHAVRAVYMYAGMTDIAAIYGDSAYRAAVDKLWENVVHKKMYITGGLGASRKGEAFGVNYDLPNKTAYAETCAAIGGVYWNERIFRLTGEAKYFDILERMLYDGIISGISNKGTEFFYANPLESDGEYAFNSRQLTRAKWFDTSCCPTNLIRFIPYIPSLIYAVQNNELYINLFMANRTKVSLANTSIEIEQKTAYLWNGTVEIAINPATQTAFTLKDRILAWAQDRFESDLYHFTNKQNKAYAVKVNGKTANGELKNGYLEISRTWKKGDRITLDFPMEIRTVVANELVKDDAGKMAVERGPLVYCREKPLKDNSAFPSFLNKNQVLNYKGLTLIPYYSWSNRGAAEMKVWLDKQTDTLHGK